MFVIQVITSERYCDTRLGFEDMIKILALRALTLRTGEDDMSRRHAVQSHNAKSFSIINSNRSGPCVDAT